MKRDALCELSRDGCSTEEVSEDWSVDTGLSDNLDFMKEDWSFCCGKRYGECVG